MTAKEYIIKQAIPFMDGGCCGLDDEQLEWHLNDYAAHKSAEDNKELVGALKKMVDQARKFYVMANYPAEDMPGYAFNECEKLIQKHSS